jgi:hypothetical protein
MSARRPRKRPRRCAWRGPRRQKAPPGSLLDPRSPRRLPSASPTGDRRRLRIDEAVQRLATTNEGPLRRRADQRYRRDASPRTALRSNRVTRSARSPREGLGDRSLRTVAPTLDRRKHSPFARRRRHVPHHWATGAHRRGGLDSQRAERGTRVKRNRDGSRTADGITIL